MAKYKTRNCEKLFFISSKNLEIAAACKRKKRKGNKDKGKEIKETLRHSKRFVNEYFQVMNALLTE